MAGSPLICCQCSCSSYSSAVTGKPVAEGTYTLTLVATGSAAAQPAEVAASIVSTGSTFIVAPY